MHLKRYAEATSEKKVYWRRRSSGHPLSDKREQTRDGDWRHCGSGAKVKQKIRRPDEKVKIPTSSLALTQTKEIVPKALDDPHKIIVREIAVSPGS